MSRHLVAQVWRALHRRALTVLRTVVAPASILPAGLRPAVYRAGGIEIGPETRVSAGLFIVNDRVRIGARCFVNAGCHIDPGEDGVVVGDDVNIGAGVIIAATTHLIGPPQRRAGATLSAPIRIGNGAWVGAGAIILAGVTVADGCIIGAGAVVTRSTEPHGVYRGVPATRGRSLLS